MRSLLSAAFLVILSINVDCQDDPAAYPPTSWCDDASLAKLVGVEKQCDAYSKAVYNKKVRVTLLYESMCVHCKDDITNLYPILYPKWKDYVNFEFVPYGNAKINATGGIDCQHGKYECQLDQIETCAIHLIKNPDIRFQYILCIEQIDVVQFILSSDAQLKKCAEKAHISNTEEKSIASCWNTDQGTQLEKLMADRTDKIWPVKHRWVPWLLLNNASTNQIQDLLDGTTDRQETVLSHQICAIYRGAGVPKPCVAAQADLRSRAECTEAPKATRNCRK